jgi:UDP-glucose 4-epimerase
VGANSAVGLGDRPKSNNKNVLPYLVDAITTGKNIVINGGDYPTKDGTAVRDFIHVSDLTYLTARLMQEINESGVHVYNVGSGTGGNSIKDIITTTGEIIGKDIQYTFNPTKDSRTAKILISSDKLNKVVKINLKHSLKDIITSQIDLKQEGDSDEE